MYFNNLKRLRNEKEYTQEYVAKNLNVTRSTYNNWERGEVMMPLEIADKLSMLYNVRLSCILGIDDYISYNPEIKELNYNKLLSNLQNLKKENNNTYEEIASYLKCGRSSCYRYFTGFTALPVDRLISLSDLYDVDLDKLCDKE